MRLSDILFWALVVLGSPLAILAALCGLKLGDGTGNESSFASFAAFSAVVGGVLGTLIVLAIIVTTCLSR